MDWIHRAVNCRKYMYFTYPANYLLINVSVIILKNILKMIVTMTCLLTTVLSQDFETLCMNTKMFPKKALLCKMSQNI